MGQYLCLKRDSLSIRKGIEYFEQALEIDSTRITSYNVCYTKLLRLEAARDSGTMAGERRVVTMLFCDVKGSTASAERLDPEEWTDIINGAFEHMIRPVYNYEGTVVHIMGDGLLAFFGAPIAHEDDPQRAVLAGLDIISVITSYSIHYTKLYEDYFLQRLNSKSHVRAKRIKE